MKLNNILKENNINENKKLKKDLLLEYYDFEKNMSDNELVDNIMILRGIDSGLNINELHRSSKALINKYKNEINKNTKKCISSLDIMKPRILDILNNKDDLLIYCDTNKIIRNEYEYTLDVNVPNIIFIDGLNEMFEDLNNDKNSLENILNKYIETIINKQYRRTIRGKILDKNVLLDNRDFNIALYRVFRNNSDKVNIIINKKEMEFIISRFNSLNNEIIKISKMETEIINQLSMNQKKLEELFNFDDKEGSIIIPEIGLKINLFKLYDNYENNTKKIKQLTLARIKELEFIAQCYTKSLSYRYDAIIKEYLFYIKLCNDLLIDIKQMK